VPGIKALRHCVRTQLRKLTQQADATGYYLPAKTGNRIGSSVDGGQEVVVAGATGLVGSAALRHFSASEGCEVVALSATEAARNCTGPATFRSI